MVVVAVGDMRGEREVVGKRELGRLREAVGRAFETHGWAVVRRDVVTH